MDYTNFYTPKHSDNFKLSKYEELEIPKVWRMQNALDDYSDSDNPHGVFDWATYSALYKKLLLILNINELSNLEIYNELQEKWKESCSK